jgi:hypothetical protein
LGSCRVNRKNIKPLELTECQRQHIIYLKSFALKANEDMEWQMEADVESRNDCLRTKDIRASLCVGGIELMQRGGVIMQKREKSIAGMMYLSDEGTSSGEGQRKEVYYTPRKKTK